jgi:hypothetical protein
MNFNRLIKDSKEGLKRKISSRRERISVSVDEFNNLSKKHFNQIKEGENLTIKYDKKTTKWYTIWYTRDKQNTKPLKIND